MSEQNDETAPDSAENESWAATVREFEAEATWLTGADRPQLKALYSIAAALDNGAFQAALISQFTLIHRALLARRPGEGGGKPKSQGDELLEMFENNPGVWKA